MLINMEILGYKSIRTQIFADIYTEGNFYNF